MTKEYKVGGISSMMGIEFQGERYSASINLQKNDIDISLNPFYSDNAILKFLKKIPFVRGFMMIALLIVRLLFFLFRANKFLFILIAGVLFYSFFAPHEAVESVSHGFFWDNYPLFLFGCGAALFIWSVRKNHTIEHKMISAFDNGRKLSLENIRIQPKENKRCGGVLAAWFLLLSFILKFSIGFYSPMIDICLVSVAYEFFMVAQMKNILGSIFYAPGWLIQKLTTAKNVSDADILKAREAFIQLLQKENQGYIL